MKKNALRLTRALKKTVEKHGLELVHVGSLSYKGNRYVNSDFIKKEEIPHTAERNCLIVFNHYENMGMWSVWETPMLSYDDALEIWKEEKDRRLWDSRMFYYIKGKNTFLML